MMIYEIILMHSPSQNFWTFKFSLSNLKETFEGYSLGEECPLNVHLSNFIVAVFDSAVGISDFSVNLQLMIVTKQKPIFSNANSVLFTNPVLQC